MEDFLFRLPTRVLFGAGVVNKVGQACKDQKAAKVFLVTGKTSTKDSPFLQVVINSLGKVGMEVKLYAEIEADPSVDTVDRGGRYHEAVWG